MLSNSLCADPIGPRLCHSFTPKACMTSLRSSRSSSSFSSRMWEYQQAFLSSELRRQILAFTPLIPGAIIICQRGIVQHRQAKEHSCGGNTSITISDNMLLRLDMGGSENLGKFFIAAKGNPCINQRFAAD